MDRGLFYLEFFKHLHVFFFAICFCVYPLYKIANKISISGLLDPIMFYWVFTFGTAYGIVLGLFYIGYIPIFYFFLVLSYGVILSSGLILFQKLSWRLPPRIVKLIAKDFQPRSVVKASIFLIFLGLTVVMVTQVGFGMFAAENRFEQNRGSGAVVRLFTLFRLFFAAYLGVIFLKCARTRRSRQRTMRLIIVSLTWIFFTGFMSAIDGAKFAFLETLITSVVGATIFAGKKLSLSKKTALLGGFFSLVFALGIYSINLQNNGQGSKESSFIPGVPFVVEALGLRVLANGDKYFLGLPNGVVETAEIKPAWVRIVGSLISSTAMSRIVGYDINDYSVGKQILYYWEPSWDIAGGPTSHFDLYSYKQFGVVGGAFFTLFIAFVLIGVRKGAVSAEGNLYASSVLGVMWVRSWAIIIEPPLGIAYIFDVLLVFGLIALFRGYFLPRK